MQSHSALSMFGELRGGEEGGCGEVITLGVAAIDSPGDRRVGVVDALVDLAVADISVNPSLDFSYASVNPMVGVVDASVNIAVDDISVNPSFAFSDASVTPRVGVVDASVNRVHQV